MPNIHTFSAIPVVDGIQYFKWTISGPVRSKAAWSSESELEGSKSPARKKEGLFFRGTKYIGRQDHFHIIYLQTCHQPACHKTFRKQKIQIVKSANCWAVMDGEVLRGGCPYLGNQLVAEYKKGLRYAQKDIVFDARIFCLSCNICLYEVIQYSQVRCQVLCHGAKLLNGARYRIRY